MRDVESEVAEQCDSLVTCNICKEKFFTLDDAGIPKVPKVLECLHSFCDTCLKQYISSRGHITSLFPCPTCRKSNMWPRRGVEGFPTDRKAQLILNLMDILNDSSFKGGERPACKVCASNKVERRSDFFSTEGMQMLCGQCFRSHKSSAVLGHHKFIDLSSGAIIQDNPTNKPLCKKHQLLIMYTCTTCKEILCQCCLFSHKGHQFVVADSLRKTELSDSGSFPEVDFSKLSEDIETAKGRLEGVVMAEKEVEKGLEASKEAINRAHKEARAELDRMHGEMLQRVKVKKADLVELTTFKKKLSSMVKEAERLVEKGVSEKSREKVGRQVRSLMEGLHKAPPPTRKVLFTREVVVRMGEMVEEDLNETTGESSHYGRSTHLSSTSELSQSVSSSSDENNNRVSNEWIMKDAVIESLKINTILRKDREQSDRMIETFRTMDSYLWRVSARCKSCCFACKGRVLVCLDASEREVSRQMKVLHSSDGAPINVHFELGDELVNRLIDCKADKNNLYLLCSCTNQQTLLKRFKFDLPSKLPRKAARELTLKCSDTTNLDLLASHIIDPVGLALRRNTLAILANKGTSLHLFSAKLKPISRLTATDIGRSNYVELDGNENVYISDVGRGEIRVFDRAGQIRSNFSFIGQEGLQMAPQGICVDEKSCILLVDQALGTVSLYDTNNHLVGHVVERLSSPLALAYSSEHHLIAVTNDASVQVHEI